MPPRLNLLQSRIDLFCKLIQRLFVGNGCIQIYVNAATTFTLSPFLGLFFTQNRLALMGADGEIVAGYVVETVEGGNTAEIKFAFLWSYITHKG